MTVFFFKIHDLFYLLVNILTNVHQMNVIQTDSFEILYLGNMKLWYLRFVGSTTVLAFF